MKKVLILIFIIFTNQLFCQQTKQWLDKIKNPKYPSQELKKNNLKEKYIDYDFSTLLIPKREFLGYIGKRYKRIYIYYTSISKDQKINDLYTIKGTSIVGNNKCDFTGTIQIEQIREYKNMHFGIDDKLKNSGLKAQGVLIGSYLFKENPNQNHSGQFEGIVTLFWYKDKFDIIHYDHIESYSDNYKNNQYVGTWTEYNKQNSKICNWGEYRIPFSGDLDIGAGYFSSNPKYFNMGWRDLNNN